MNPFITLLENVNKSRTSANNVSLSCMTEKDRQKKTKNNKGKRNAKLILSQELFTGMRL
jgi:hypothetical protein